MENNKNIPRKVIADNEGWNTCPTCRDIYQLITTGQEKCESCGQLFKWSKENYEPKEDQIGCKDCPDDECNGHCMSCSYRPV
jgi:hypothetical protein